MSPSLARRERHDLCDLALQLGPDAPTLCGGWSVRDLVAHLLVREHGVVAALGIAVPFLSGWTDRSMQRVSRRPLPAMVERLREPGLTPYALPVVERVANTLEYLVHHEDIRRAQPGWSPRDLARADQDLVWKLVTLPGKGLVRGAGVPVVIARSDVPGARTTLRAGSDPVVLTGLPSEITLVLFGRDQVRDVSFEGPPERVASFQEADRGA